MSCRDQAINDPEPSPEDSAAMEQQSASSHHSHLQNAAANSALEDPEKSSQKLRPGSDKRADGSSRSKPPKEADLTQARSFISHSDRILKKSRWLGSVNAYKIPTGRASKTSLRQIDLTWAKDSSKRLIFISAAPQASMNIDATNYVSWQYDSSVSEFIRLAYDR